MRIAVVGLGKLGGPLAAVLASKGNEVLGVDVNAEVVRLVNEGRAPVDEPGLQDLVTASRERLSATTDFAAAADSEVIIFLVPTPSDERGAFTNAYILAALEGSGRHFKGVTTIKSSWSGARSCPARATRRSGRRSSACQVVRWVTRSASATAPSSSPSET